MIEFVKNLAIQAGTMALADRKVMSGSSVHSKATVRDLVTDTDRKVERFLVEALKKKYPDYGFFGEECGKDRADSEYCWVIDPIDGTTSFIFDSANWCVSIGLRHRGKGVLGVIYAPVMRRLYYAEAGQGAYCNGEQIHVSTRSKLEECVVGTGFSCLRAGWTEENNLKFCARIAPIVCDIRKYGSAALDLCEVARGSLDAVWELFLQPYDIAAGEVILNEAGGKITDFRNGPNYPGWGTMSSNGAIHEEILSFFRDYRHLQK